MVTTFFPATSDIGMLQERIASPLRCTVQAPQSATPQPNFVPVRPSSSRRYHMSGIDGSPSNVRSRPFTFTLTIFPPVAGFLRRGLPLQLRAVAEISAAGVSEPPYTVTSPAFICCSAKSPVRNEVPGHRLRL